MSAQSIVHPDRYFASGKKKHDRYFWISVDDAVINRDPRLCWDKKKKQMPNKMEALVAVDSAPPGTTYTCTNHHYLRLVARIRISKIGRCDMVLVPAAKSAKEWFDIMDMNRDGGLDEAEIAVCQYCGFDTFPSPPCWCFSSSACCCLNGVDRQVLYQMAQGSKLEEKKLKKTMKSMDENSDGKISFRQSL